MSDQQSLTHREPSLGGQHTIDESPQLGGDAALTHAIQALGDPDWQARNWAVEMLEQIGGERVLDLLLGALNDENWAVQRRATLALGVVGGERAFQGLLTALKMSDPQIRAGAAEALGRTGDNRAVEPLIEMMLILNRSNVRDAIDARQAARTLERFDDTRAIPALVEMSTKRAYWQETEYNWALAQFYERNPQPVIDCLAQHLSKDHNIVSVVAALKPPEITPLLMDRFTALQKNGHQRDLWIIIRTMAATQDPMALSLLSQRINDTTLDYYERRQIIGVVEHLGGTAGSPVLIEAITANTRVSRWAARALTRVRDRQAIPSLVTLLSHPEWRVRKLAAYVLGRRHIHSAIPALMKTLQDGRAKVRAEAALALGRIKAEEAIPVLAACLEDRVQLVRGRAAQALVRLHSRYPEAFSGYVAALQTAQVILG